MKNPLPRLLITVILWMTMLTVSAQGQKVYIESFTHDPMDQAAKEYKKIDSSGNLYAIVKVRPTGKDFKFSFGYMACSVQGEHEDETWLYVQKNARKISISRPGFVAIKDADLGITLEAGETYHLNISYVEPEVAVQKQWLRFSVVPTDVKATVKVKKDGASNYEIWGQTVEGSLARNLECGRYDYQIVADSYIMSEGVVTLNKPNETLLESITLRPNYGYLQIDDVHGISGAQVFVNDKYVGNIPYKESTKWTCGEYNISITNGELYKNYNAKFTINQGETTVLKPKLESNAAETTIRVDADADIYLDGKLLGKREWKGPLRAGRYKIECKQDKHYTSQKTLTVVANETQEFLANAPKPITGSLSVTSTPLDAEIIIDGNRVGVTPMTIPSLIIGNHTVTLNRQNSKSEVREITIEENKTTSLDVMLTRNSKMSNASKSSNIQDNKGTNKNTKPTSERQSSQSKAETCIYIQPTIQVGSMMAVGAIAGGYVSNFNIEADFMAGIGNESLYWNYMGESENKMPIEEQFSASHIGARLGYGISVGNKLRFTPQAGVGITLLSGNQGSKGNAMGASIGCRLDYAFCKFAGINLTPEYDIPVSKSNVFQSVADVSSKVNGWGSGVNVKLGIYLFF